ncbi:MAG: hypothetical protein JNK79_06335 [Chitinophagaceae bacterium]|nr:hypothetical protein [Chitinophagaceae bacterium]
MLIPTTFASAQVEIRGVYGHPQGLWDKGFRLDSLGVNAIFLHDKSISAELMKRARNENVKVFAEFATLNGKGYVENHPEAWAIDSSGKKVQSATWFMGVCPSDPVFRKHRTDALKKLLSDFDVDGVWMDYVHWHAQFEDPDPILPETCFCNKCTSGFEKHTGITVSGNGIPGKARFILNRHEVAWREWRASVIANWAAEFRQIISKEKPGALLGLYHCPWNDEDFNGARYRILGLDYNKLEKEVDVFSPMVYHNRMGRKAEWVKENIEWFSKIVPNKKIWPIVQASNEPANVSAKEFEKVLRYGLSGRATGVMMFTTYAVAGEPAKIEVLKKVYHSTMQ